MKLYKYRSLSDQPVSGGGLTDIEKVRKTILNHELWFASPNTFNDPFDCFPSIIGSGTKKEKLKFMHETLKRNFPEKSRREIREIAKKRMSEGLSLQESFDGVDLREKFEIHKVFCLSETKKSILMWSHYANNHKGICLGFEGMEKHSIFGMAQKVNYNEELLTINWLTDDFYNQIPKKLIQAFFEKSEHWKYEKERRILHPNNRSMDTYKPGELKQIILGAEISDNDREHVMSWHDQLIHKPELLQARLHPRKYEMEIISI